MRPPKLFLVTREDLPNGVQAVQAAHAMTEFTMKYPEEARDWYLSSNHLALLSVSDEYELEDLLELALSRGFLATPFYEPDREDEMTAIALEPAAKGLVRGLPLALR